MESVKLVPLSEAPLTIGRASARDPGRRAKSGNLLFHNSHVSKVHARIVLEDSKVFLEDLASTFGTIWNRNLLVPYKRVLLSEGDTIGLVINRPSHVVKALALKNKVVPLSTLPNARTQINFRVLAVDLACGTLSLVAAKGSEMWFTPESGVNGKSVDEAESPTVPPDVVSDPDQSSRPGSASSASSSASSCSSASSSADSSLCSSSGSSSGPGSDTVCPEYTIICDTSHSFEDESDGPPVEEPYVAHIIRQDTPDSDASEHIAACRSIECFSEHSEGLTPMVEYSLDEDPDETSQTIAEYYIPTLVADLSSDNASLLDDSASEHLYSDSDLELICEHTEISIDVAAMEDMDEKTVSDGESDSSELSDSLEGGQYISECFMTRHVPHVLRSTHNDHWDQEPGEFPLALSDPYERFRLGCDSEPSDSDSSWSTEKPEAATEQLVSTATLGRKRKLEAGDEQVVKRQKLGPRSVLKEVLKAAVYIGTTFAALVAYGAHLERQTNI